MDAGGHRDRHRHRPAFHARSRREGAARAAVPHRSLDRQAHRLGRRRPRGRPLDADPWRHGHDQGPAARTLVPRDAHPPRRRGPQRSTAHGDRARDPGKQSPMSTKPPSGPLAGKRTATGQGSLVNTSLFESGLMWASNHIAGYSVTGKMPARQGSGHPSLTPYQAFHCTDGLLMVCPGNDRLWRKFAEVLGHPEWPDEPRYKLNVDRMKEREALLPAIAEIMKKQSRADWSAKLDAVGVPHGPLNSLPQVL